MLLFLVGVSAGYVCSDQSHRTRRAILLFLPLSVAFLPWLVPVITTYRAIRKEKGTKSHNDAVQQELCCSGRDLAPIYLLYST